MATPVAARDVVLFRSPDVKVDWGHKNLASTKCEEPKTISEMEATIVSMQWPKGQRAFEPGSTVRIYHSRTVTARADQLVCRIMMKSSLAGSGKFVVRIRGAGKWDIYFQDHD